MGSRGDDLDDMMEAGGWCGWCGWWEEAVVDKSVVWPGSRLACVEWGG